MPRNIVFTDKAAKPPAVYSQAVKAAGLVFVSGTAPVDPATGATVALWCDESYPYLMIFTGDALPDADRRRTGLAVEPMTCAPDAFRSGDGLVVLEPGTSASGAWGISAGAGARPG